jgi:hypothetical protein
LSAAQSGAHNAPNMKLGSGPLVALLLFVASPAFGQQADESTRTAARALGDAGVEAYQANDFATATDKLEKAYAILKVPTLGLWSGRALVQLGKWVEASERFLEVTSLQVPSGDVVLQKQAQADAAVELKTLTPRVPVVAVAVQGAQLADCTVSVDGQPVASSLLATGRLMNPGKHLIEARHGSDVARTELTVAEGERPTALLEFAPPPPAPLVAAPVPPPPARETSAQAGSTQRTWGWVAVGAGGLGLVVGGITGGVALGKKGELDDNSSCRDDRCAPSESDQVDSYNAMRTASSIGFIAGGAFAALGVVLLATAPNQAKAQAYIGPHSVGVRGRF